MLDNFFKMLFSGETGYSYFPIILAFILIITILRLKIKIKKSKENEQILENNIQIKKDILKNNNIENNIIQKENSFNDFEKIEEIVNGLGGKNNLNIIDNCATRLRLKVKDSTVVNDVILKKTGAMGVIKKDKNVQVIYGPAVVKIKEGINQYLKN